METFKHTQIELMLNKSLKGKAPPDWERDDWRRYYRAFKRARLTPHVMAGMIWQGYSFAPCYTNGRRIENNFDVAYHMAFDFDEDGAALDYLMHDGSFAWLFSSFAYSTPSSSPEHPKSRVVFVIPDGIHNPQDFRKLYQAIAVEFEREGSKTDPSCKDPLRLYYGSENCQIAPNWSALLSENIKWILERYRKENPPVIQAHDETVIRLPADESDVDFRVSLEVDRVRTAVEGEKHNTRIKAAYTVGGYVGAGHLSMIDAESRLIPAARANSSVPDVAEAEIKNCLQRGAAMPLPIEVRIKKDGDDVL